MRPCKQIKEEGGHNGWSLQLIAKRGIGRVPCLQPTAALLCALLHGNETKARLRVDAHTFISTRPCPHTFKSASAASTQALNRFNVSGRRPQMKLRCCGLCGEKVDSLRHLRKRMTELQVCGVCGNGKLRSLCTS